jgi:hypothetical protein
LIPFGGGKYVSEKLSENKDKEREGNQKTKKALSTRCRGGTNIRIPESSYCYVDNVYVSIVKRGE